MEVAEEEVNLNISLLHNHLNLILTLFAFHLGRLGPRDNTCYSFRDTGNCKHGDRCRFDHGRGGSGGGGKLVFFSLTKRIECACFVVCVVLFHLDCRIYRCIDV